MTDEILSAIGEVVDKKINGKLNEIKGTLVEHGQKLDALAPVVQATLGGKVLYKVFLTAGAIALTWIAIRNALHL